MRKVLVTGGARRLRSELIDYFQMTNKEISVVHSISDVEQDDELMTIKDVIDTLSNDMREITKKDKNNSNGYLQGTKINKILGKNKSIN